MESAINIPVVTTNTTTNNATTYKRIQILHSDNIVSNSSLTTIDTKHITPGHTNIPTKNQSNTDIFSDEESDKDYNVINEIVFDKIRIRAME